MLWYKAWLETRWRFLTGLVLCIASCGVVIFTQPLTENMQISIPDLGAELNKMVQEALRLASTYPGYVWSQWFGKNLLQLWMFFAVIIGVGGVVAEGARGSAQWTLSLPVTRRRLFGVRAGMGAAELLALAVVPSLFIPLFSRSIGKSYPVSEVLIYSLILFVGGLSVYCLALLLSTIFAEQLKAIIIGVVLVFGVSLLPLFDARLTPYMVATLMSGQEYFKTGALPWAALAAYTALAVALYMLALRVLERRDF
ncbi:MAG TPA: hypothetical protein VGV59_13120 [Pyrinomonadaceae bacterium]|nr:hypothetical protein [Pyrinomonadaceae bacterium]